MSIRLITPYDAEELFVVIDRNRSHLRRWHPWLDDTTEQKHVEAYLDRVLHGYADKKTVTFVVTDDDDNRIIGTCSLNQIDWQTSTAWIGYWLAEDQQGKGIMTRSAQALLTYAFETLGLQMCQLRAAVENRKSRAVAERLGFRHDGTLRRAENLYGTVVDHAVYSLLKSEWHDWRRKIHVAGV